MTTPFEVLGSHEKRLHSLQEGLCRLFFAGFGERACDGGSDSSDKDGISCSAASNSACCHPRKARTQSLLGGCWRCMLPFLFLCPFCSCDCVALKLRSLCNHLPRLRRFAVIEYKPTFSVSCCLLWSPVPFGCMRASLQIRGKITFIRVDRISSQL